MTTIEEPDFIADCTCLLTREERDSILLEIFKNRVDFSTAQAKLQELSKSNSDQIQEFADTMIWFGLFQSQSNANAAIDYTPSSTISVQSLGKTASSMKTEARQLMERIADFQVDASMFAYFQTEAACDVLLESIQTLRTAKEKLDEVARISEAWSLRLKRQKRRSIRSPDSPIQIFVRRLARTWLRAGGKVSTAGDSDFSEFLEYAFRAIGRKVDSLSDSLAGALKEAKRRDGVDDIFSESRRNDQLRRARSFDAIYRRRPTANLRPESASKAGDLPLKISSR